MTVLVAIPFKGAPELLPRAVESALAQTERDIRVVVYGDGDPVPALPADPRLVIHQRAVNRGPYFALQAMLQASPFEHFAPMGADDYVNPDHLEQMLPLVEASTAVITGRVWWHAAGRPVKPASVNYEVGLFRTDRLLAFGGYNPAERVGQDSLFVNLVRITGPHAVATQPTYHRCLRPGSLSTSRETGNHTTYRNDVRRRNRQVYARCLELARAGKPRALREYRAQLIPRPVATELACDVDLLRTELAA